MISSDSQKNLHIRHYHYLYFADVETENWTLPLVTQVLTAGSLSRTWLLQDCVDCVSDPVLRTSRPFSHLILKMTCEVCMVVFILQLGKQVFQMFRKQVFQM